MADQSKSSCANRRDDIPIAIDTEVVMKLWLNEKYVNNLPRTIRFTVYLKILDLLADMLSCAYSARFDKENRKAHLDKYINDLQCVKSYTRIIHESGLPVTTLTWDFSPNRNLTLYVGGYGKVNLRR